MIEKKVYQLKERKTKVIKVNMIKSHFPFYYKTKFQVHSKERKKRKEMKKKLSLVQVSTLFLNQSI